MPVAGSLRLRLNLNKNPIAMNSLFDSAVLKSAQALPSGGFAKILLPACGLAILCAGAAIAAEEAGAVEARETQEAESGATQELPPMEVVASADAGAAGDFPERGSRDQIPVPGMRGNERAAAAEVLRAHGMVQEQVPVPPFVHRRFESADEQARAIANARAAGHETDGVETTGHFHAQVLLARPEADAAAAPVAGWALPVGVAPLP